MSNKQAGQILPSPNKAGRPKGSRNKKTIIRDALSTTFASKGITGEQGFWLAVCAQAQEGDMQAMAMLADRLSPKLRPESQTVALPEPLTGSPADMAKQLIKFVGQGAIPTSTATELLSALANVVKIEEVTELMERITKLEELSQ